MLGRGSRDIRLSGAGAVLAAGLLTGFACAEVVVASRAASAPRADLVVTRTLPQANEVVAGNRLVVRFTTRNRGSRSAPRATTRFHLSSDRRPGRGDLVLAGELKTPGLRPGRSSTGVARVTVPSATPAGRYFVIACADSGRKVRERSEGNNCRSSRRRLTITATTIKYRYAFSNRADQDLMPSYGYNLIDVSSKDEADATPAGTRGLVWLGDYDNTTCDWEVADATITADVRAMAGDPKVAGYFFANESDPFGCPDAISEHRARNALIKSLDPEKFTLITVDSNSGADTLRQIPMWAGAADYIDYNPYICYQGKACDYAWLDTILAAAEQAGNPYFVALQAFGDDEWRWPTAAEEKQMLDRLKTSGATGYMTFSWNWNNDPLLAHPDVLDQIKQFNLATPGGATASKATSPGGHTAQVSNPVVLAVGDIWPASGG